MPTESGPSHRDELQASAAYPPAGEPKVAPAGWRDHEFITVAVMRAVSGLSAGAIYNLHHRGLLRLRRVAGRTMARPAEFVAALRGVEEAWSPAREGSRGAAGRAARWADAAQPAEAT